MNRPKDFPYEMTVEITDRWFGYDHFAVQDCFFEYDRSGPLQHGATAKYVRAGDDGKPLRKPADIQRAVDRCDDQIWGRG